MSSLKASSSTKRARSTRQGSSTSDEKRQRSAEADSPHDGDLIPDLADLNFIWSSTEATQPGIDTYTNEDQEDDTDDEMDWEEVAVDASEQLQYMEEPAPETRGFEITLDLPEKQKIPRQCVPFF